MQPHKFARCEAPPPPRLLTASLLQHCKFSNGVYTRYNEEQQQLSHLTGGAPQTIDHQLQASIQPPVVRGKLSTRCFTEQDRLSGEAYVQRHLASKKGKDGFVQRFLACCHLSSVTPQQAVIYALGWMIQAGLADSTIETYLQYMATTVGRNQVWRAANAAAATAHAKADSRHAWDISADVVPTIISSLSGASQAAVWMMSICGGRLADLARLQRKQIVVGRDGILSVQWRVTKQRRKRCFRLSTHHDMTSIKPPPGVVKFFWAL